MMRVIIRRTMKDGHAVVVTGYDVIKGVVEIQRSVRPIA